MKLEIMQSILTLFFGLGVLLQTGLANDSDAGTTPGIWKPPTIKDIPKGIDPEIRLLIEQTFSEKLSVRTTTVKKLNQLRDRAQPAIPFLIRLLNDRGDIGSKEEYPGSSAFVALLEIGEPAISHLIAAMGSNNYQMRKEAVELLGHIGGPRVIDPLIEALKDPHPMVRQSAIWPLKRAQDNRAVEPLIGLLNDPATDENGSSLIAEYTASSLGDFKDTRAVSPLLKLLEDCNQESGIRESAAWSLGRIGDKRASDALLSVANDLTETCRLRAAAARALARMKDPRVFNTLKSLAEAQNSEGWTDAIAGLGHLGDDRSVSVLMELLGKEGRSGETAGEVAFAIIEADKPKGIDTLIRFIETEKDTKGYCWGLGVEALALSSNPRAYLQAIDTLRDTDNTFYLSALGAFVTNCGYGDLWEGHTGIGTPETGPQAIKDPRIVEPLIELIKNPKIDESVRNLAITALRKTQDPQAIKFLDSLQVDSKKAQP